MLLTDIARTRTTRIHTKQKIWKYSVRGLYNMWGQELPDGFETGDGHLDLKVLHNSLDLMPLLLSLSLSAMRHTRPDLYGHAYLSCTLVSRASVSLPVTHLRTLIMLVLSLLMTDCLTNSLRKA
jgi:hypothetical protein